jgi:hypothetical protein
MIGSCIAMFTHFWLNKQKEIKCREEGIDLTQAGLFRDMGDASPLFRCVIIGIPVTKETHYIAGIPSRQDTAGVISLSVKVRWFIALSTVGNRN